MYLPACSKTPAHAHTPHEQAPQLRRLAGRPPGALEEPLGAAERGGERLLEERVAGFDGTLLLVSHDRAFLDRVVTSLLVLASLLASIEENLPKTSYFKKIDVWFMSYIIFIFVIIVFHIIVDYCIKHDDQVNTKELLFGTNFEDIEGFLA